LTIPYYLSARGRLPTINIIHRQPHRPAFFPEWHTTQDDLSVIDKATLLAVGHTLMVVILQSPLRLFGRCLRISGYFSTGLVV
jgi:hypothetical protein